MTEVEQLRKRNLELMKERSNMANLINHQQDEITALKAFCEDSKHVIMVVANADTKAEANELADSWLKECPIDYK